MAIFHTIVTHSGPFHADDVLAVTVLKDLEPAAAVLRTRDMAVLDAARTDPTIVLVDVGWSYDAALQDFDHHQKDFQARRDNGVPYASIGLVWKTWGDRWLEQVMEIHDEDERAFVFDRIDEDFLASVDAFDCGVVRGTHSVEGGTGELRVPSIASLLGAYNPVWFEVADFDARFQEACDVARGMLRRQARIALAEMRFRNTVSSADDGGPILVLPTAGPWQRAVSDHHLVVVFPAVGESGWLVQAVGDPKSTQFPPPLRITFPEAWRGQSPDALRELTGIPSMTFCHRAGFIGGAADREDAVQLAKYVVEQDARI